MARVFDYKFMIIIGLSLIVYFLYREVEILNIRISKLENINIKKELIELPPPPLDEINPVEEYSNEHIHTHSNKHSSEHLPLNIYSQDLLNTHTQDTDTQMIESINNLVTSPVKENKTQSDINTNNNMTIDDLLKYKLDKLINMATELNINILNDNGKKKKKIDLANEIFKSKLI